MRFGLSLVLAVCAFAQDPPQTEPPKTEPPKDQPQIAETVTKDEPATFKARVNLVMVPVVVRDKKGNAIGNLKQEDFQLLDKGKPQIISRFSMERPGLPGGAKNGAKISPKTDADRPPLELPERYIAYIFDDVHIQFGDLARTRDAAWAHIRDTLRPSDRAAIYSTSGQTSVEFTDDRDKLRGALFTLMPRPIARSMTQECPDVSYYMGDLIQNHNDPMALDAATREAIVCASMDPSDPNSRNVAQSMARAASSRAISGGAHETRLALGVLRDIIRHMAAMPGQRVVVLASPGFITPEDHTEKMDVIDRAIRNNVTINSLDARGLWVDGTDMTKQMYDFQASRLKAQYEHDTNVANADVLAELAYGTGGKFFQNSNDLGEGFRRLTETPEYMYLLGFSPQNLKLDGSFHSLKVTVRTTPPLTAVARKGYYAPRHLTDPAETAKEEIREALFSREELREIPVDLQSQFFKPSNETAKVTIVTHIDLKALKFKKVEDRNNDEVTIVAGLFDRNGNYVTGVQKLVQMKLKDETLAARQNLGITVRSTVDVKPGPYLIRVVIRDAGGEQMSAQNSAVDIP